MLRDKGKYTDRAQYLKQAVVRRQKQIRQRALECMTVSRSFHK